MPDPFSAQPDNLSSPCSHLATVTPNDAADLEVPSRGLWIGTQGDLKVTSLAGEVVTLPGALGLLPIRVRRVWASGTQASGIVAMW